ncbi:unnamed protein product, partial [Gadus morhua 'NCC']
RATPAVWAEDAIQEIHDSGKIYSWGSGQEGQLGHGDSRTRVSRPCLLGSPHLEGGVRRVGAGDSYSSAVAADGELVLWGRIPSLSGDADRKVFQRLWSPQPVPLEGMKVLEVACGTWHMMALVTGLFGQWSSGSPPPLRRRSTCSFPARPSGPQTRPGSRHTAPGGEETRAPPGPRPRQTEKECERRRRG